MTEHLKHAGIPEPYNIDHYTLRSEVDSDILKIYYTRKKGQIFQKSVKLKFPRHIKKGSSDYGTSCSPDRSEIDANLVHILAELDGLAGVTSETSNQKDRLLRDLNDLEQMVTNKIREIEAAVKKL